MSINDDLEMYTAAAGMIDITTGKPDRSWFLESVERSRRAIKFGEEERDRELQRIIQEGYGDHDTLS